jgi:PPOX class probable F420-dependent enzyme
MMLDFTTPFGQRAADRLRSETIIWLATKGRDGTPQARPVWFWWDGDETVLIFSKPNTHKLRHLQNSPHAALHFDSDGSGGDIVVFTATARVDPEALTAHRHPQYREKYRPVFERINMSAEEFAEAYSVPIRAQLKSLRGH